MSYELMFQKAVALQQNGALNEAEQLYRQILETSPQNADVLNLLGLIAQARGLHSEAVGYFYRAADSAPQHFPIFFNLGVSLAASGYLLEATEAYKKALKIKPDLKEAYLGLGNVFWQLERMPEASEAYQNALKIDSAYLDAAVNLAELQNNKASLLELAAKNPAEARPCYYLGRREFAEKNYSEALKFLQQADTLLAADEIKVLLAETYLALHQTDQALPIFYQALRLNPHNVAASLHIADLEAEKENYAEAENFYKKTLELDNNNLQAHANYANMLCKRKRTLEALEEYRAAVRISPETPELSYNLAIILKTLEEYEQALALMFNAFYLAPQHTDWSLNLAETITLFYDKAPEKARKIAENWYEKMPENPIVKHLWAVINGQNPENESEYNRLLFDNFAETYENALRGIHYAVVDKIAEIAENVSGNILDLGCGTGLLAKRLKSFHNSFVGVDLSQEMLQKAREKNVYHKLEQADIVDYLHQHKGEFQTVMAADVFCYFGDLSKIINELTAEKVIFSVETDLQTEEYKVQANGRYKHNPLYVENLLKQAGYQKIKTYTLVLRQENGKDVEGMIFEAEI